MEAKVICGIGSSKIEEAVGGHDYYGFLGKEKDIPGKHIGHGVFETADGKFVHHNGTKSVSFRDQESAEDFASARRNKFKKELTAAHETMSKNTRPLSDDELATAKQYTDHLNHYKRKDVTLNEHLHHGIELDDKQKEFVGKMDTLLGSHQLHDDAVVYTGTSKKHAELLRKHDFVNHPGYLSTSLSQNSARAFAQDKGGDILKIHLPKGHPGLYVSHLSNYEGEREFVLPRNTKMSIHRDKEQVLIHDGGTFRVHHATVE